MKKFSLLFVIVSIVGIPSNLDRFVSQTCLTITKKSGVANAILTKFNRFLDQDVIRSQYPLSAEYIDSISNRQELNGDIVSCKNFFGGLKDAAVSDLIKNGKSAADAETIFFQILKENSV